MTDVVVEQCDPREREAELKELFARNGKPAFAEVFDRAYRLRAAQGLRSWVGLQNGRVVMHASVTPLRFVGGGRSFAGGIMSDLMADDGYRDFWAPVRLLRKLTADLKRAGQMDFLLTTTTPEAEPVFKAGGFKPFATLRRYVLPLNPLYLAAARMRARVRRTRTQASALEHWANDASLSADAELLRPHATAEFYRSRIPRMEFTDGRWIRVANGRTTSSGYTLLARNPDHDELRLADAIWNTRGIGLGEIVHAAARWGRTEGFKKFSVDTMHESRAAADLQRYGFFARDVRSTLLLNALSPNQPPPPEDWFLLGFALSGW